MGAVGVFVCVLCMPCRGRFMCPFAVAGLGLRYLRMSFLVMLGQPFRKPLRTAFSRVEIFGLQSDWCANLIPLLCVRTECVNDARLTPSCNVCFGCRAQSTKGGGHERVDCIPAGVIGNVHKSVDGSLYPCKITFPSYSTSHLSLSKMTQHPTLQRGRIPTSKARAKFGTMCLVKTVGRPGIPMSHTWVDQTFLPLGRLIVNGFAVVCLLTMLTPSIMKMDVAPLSAIA